jgi:hypothetical protein
VSTLEDPGTAPAAGGQVNPSGQRDAAKYSKHDDSVEKRA